MGTVVVSLLETGRIDEERLALYRGWLTREELAASARNIDPGTVICARGLVRERLSRFVARVDPSKWTFARSEAGKPYVTGPFNAPFAAPFAKPEHSLSHTDGLVVCALARTPVGVDAEAISRGEEIRETVRRAFAREEVEAMEELPVERQERRAIELWTVKEAYLKGLGTGISRHLDRFVVTPLGEGTWRVEENPVWSITCRTHANRWIVATATAGPSTIAFRDVLTA